jgi:hypothetical protein
MIEHNVKDDKRKKGKKQNQCYQSSKDRYNHPVMLSKLLDGRTHIKQGLFIYLYEHHV